MPVTVPLDSGPSTSVEESDNHVHETPPASTPVRANKKSKFSLFRSFKHSSNSHRGVSSATSVRDVVVEDTSPPAIQPNSGADGIRHHSRNRHNHSRPQTSPPEQSTLKPTIDEVPLPEGWSQQIAQTGRIFFIDHNNRTTTWIDPRTKKPSPSPQSFTKNSKGTKGILVDDLGPLPPGWEERVHRDGRIFFIDHSKFLFIWMAFSFFIFMFVKIIESLNGMILA